MMNVGNPELAFSLAALPNDGVGLARLEFIIANHIQVHPLALLNFDTTARWGRPSRHIAKNSPPSMTTSPSTLWTNWPKVVGTLGGGVLS
jgi:hypothetical protein